MKNKKTWIDDTVELYDFIWSDGLEMCGYHVNEALLENFRNGGELFENMKRKIIEKYPTAESALKAYSEREKEL